MHGCAGAEFLAGIPGTVGGALAMNAGCYGGETWEHVARVEVLDRERRVRAAHAGRVRDRLPHASTRADGARADGMLHRRRWFRFPRGDGAARARAHQGAARAAHRDPAARPAQRRQRVPQSARATTRRG